MSKSTFQFSENFNRKAFNRSKQEQLKSVAYLRFSPASAKRGLVRFLAWRIEEKEARRVLNFGKQGSYALGSKFDSNKNIGKIYFNKKGVLRVVSNGSLGSNYPTLK